jgi:hypothetical protein
MTRWMRTSISASTLALACALSLPAAAQADDPEGYGDGYQSGNYGRVRDAQNGATVLRANAEGAEPDQVGINTPVFPGDTLSTDGNQRVEVQLAGGTIVRLDRDSNVLFQALPDPGARYQDNAVIALKSGTLRILSRLADKQEFRVDTVASSVYLIGEVDVRIEIDDRGRTRVASRRGVAEVGGAGGSVLVRGGSETVVESGAVPADPMAYRALAEDGFDRWCDARNDSYRSPEPRAQAGGGGNEQGPDAVPDEVRPYYGELSAYGTWTDVPDYGTVWYPGSVAAGWRPYVDGSWCYGPGGYFWVGSEPWGWAPYHYGCWQWLSRYGWCWVPGRVFAGAWVSWSWGSSYVGWAPLDYWGRPCWQGGSRYHGYYDPGSWTFVHSSDIASGNVRRYAVPITRVGGELDRATVVARAPRVAPRDLARSAEWRDRAVHEAAQDRAARMRLTTADRVPVTKFTDVQERLARRTPAQATAPRVGHDGRGPATRPTPRVGDDPRSHPIGPRSPASSAGPAAQGHADPSTSRPAPFPRRIVEDPRQSGQRPEPRPDARSNVRDFYDRMSRPRETRGADSGRATAPDAPATRAPAAEPRRQAAPQRQDAPQRPDASRQQPRYEPAQPRSAPPRYEPAQPRSAPPRYQPERPRSAQPRYEPARPQSAPRAAPQQAPRAPAPAPRPAPRPQAQPKQEKHGHGR